MILIIVRFVLNAALTAFFLTNPRILQHIMNYAPVERTNLPLTPSSPSPCQLVFAYILNFASFDPSSSLHQESVLDEEEEEEKEEEDE